MTQYNFDYLPNRRQSDSLKWNAYDPDVLPMWVADMDFISPEPVLRALRERVDHGVFGYPMELSGQSKETPELRQVLIERLARLYHWQVQPEDILMVSGVVTGFNLVCHAMVSPQDAVLIQTPVYPPILHAAQTTGILHQEMELTRAPDGSYSVDWDAFEKSFSPQTRLFLLCNPHNPVGKVFQVDELRRIAEVCLRHGVPICSDEIHSDLVYPETRHTPIASLDPEIAQNTITLIAPSKTYNVAGLECSIAIIQNPELRQRYLKSTKGLTSFWVNLMGATAALAAYSQGQEWLDQLLVYLRANRDLLSSYIQQEMPEIHMWSPQGTYLAWLDCRQAGIPGNPYQFFLEKGRVAVNDGEIFGRGGAGFVRLNFGCPRPMLLEALGRMKKAISQLCAS